MAKAKLKTVKKKWYNIQVPASMGKDSVGKTYLADSETAIGRKLSVNYAGISGDPQKQNINIKFRITKTTNDTLETEILGLELQRSSIKRFIRRGKTRIDDSFLTTTKDKKTIRVKPLIVTKFKAKGGVRASLSKQARDWVVQELNKKSLDEAVKDLLNKQFQKALAQALKKTYPVSVSELRYIQLVENEKEVLKTVQEESIQEKANEAVEA